MVRLTRPVVQLAGKGAGEAGVGPGAVTELTGGVAGPALVRGGVVVARGTDQGTPPGQQESLAMTDKTLPGPGPGTLTAGLTAPSALAARGVSEVSRATSLHTVSGLAECNYISD